MSEISFKSGTDYAANIKSLRATLSKGGKTITDAKEHEEALIVRLVAEVTLDVLIRKSDLYLIGFKAPTDKTWFVFQNYAEFAKANAGEYFSPINKVKQTQKKEYRPADSKDTGVGCNYNDLGIFDTWLGINKSVLNKSIAALAEYSGKGSKLDTQAAAVVVFCVSEALRFESICTAVSAAIGGTPFYIDDFKDKVTNWDAAPANDTDVIIRKS